MWISKKEFLALKARVETLEGTDAGIPEEDDEHTCCGTSMIETTVFGMHGRQYTCTKCGMKRDMGIEYR